MGSKVPLREFRRKTERRYKIDLDWNDDDVLRLPFTSDTEYVFRRMTEATLSEAGHGDPGMVLDVGCGRGVDALRLYRPGRIIVGLEPSRTMLRLAKENGSDGKLLLVQGIAEQPPFRPGIFDLVMCKGALDHFPDPALCVSNWYDVLRPGGRLVVAVANFESLSCRLGKRFLPAIQRLKGNGKVEREFWEPPEDHLHLFHYVNLKNLLERHFKLHKVEGISLMWGFPYWGGLLDRLPRRVSQTILHIAGRIASKLPFFGDVIIVVATR
jgi:SAM-dependent methyltransferase